MLVQTKLKTFLELVGASTKEELIWMNGYLSGVVSAQTQVQPEPAAAKPAVGKITIAYGTETGHSKKLAADFAARAKQQGIHAKLVSLDQYRPADLSREEYFFTILSTHGEGEPPAAAKKFYDHIHQNGFKLEKLKYGVLALGDTAYPLFCKAGEDVDVQLNKLGGERIVSLQKCDTDYESDAGVWFGEVLQQLTHTNGSEIKPAQVVAKKSPAKAKHVGKLLANINLNDRGSGKQTHHIEIAAEGVSYLPGDSLGLVPENPLHIAEEVLAIAGVAADATISYRNETETFLNLLKKKLNIVYLPERVVQQYAALVQQDIPSTRMGLHDLLRIYPFNDNVRFEDVIKILEPISPRLYSISSSPEAHEGEVHLTVARDTFSVNDEWRFGLCSDHLCNLNLETGIEFYIHRNDQFRLPEEDKDVIMIGPGTGVAPFRSFIAQRDATGASGRNWLFFGDRKFTTDFLYQTEMQNWLQTGVLTKLSVAFSRDQKDKIYVQHKMQQHAAELFDWLNAGAYLYVCGAKSPMSIDVENTLLNIIQQHGNYSLAQADEYLNALKSEGRYLKDVY
ncbi:MAG TPA: flavodoxin domain-containing protein [Ferruginibacter sp.]|nr:flavodoxin domain-containing protein [Ferruginibacter sp.]